MYKKAISVLILITFVLTSVVTPAGAQSAASVFHLPSPGTMMDLTPAFAPAVVRGITVHPENPLRFDFLVDKGESGLKDAELRKESTRLVKYFLASLTVPEKELWVNLSPREQNRVIGEHFGDTEMGRDLLAQDYLLKQLAASLTHPEKDLGRKFWDNIYARAREAFGAQDIPKDILNRIWIVPEKAVVYEKDYSAFVVESHLKVLFEEEYFQQTATDHRSHSKDQPAADTAEIIKQIIIPQIEKEVNRGATFANLRQIYHSMVLAVWYKHKWQESLLAQVYADQSKTKGIDLSDKTQNQQIYNQYLETFKKGVYNYIKEEYDPQTKALTPRKYFSGGDDFSMVAGRIKTTSRLTSAHRNVLKSTDAAILTFDMLDVKGERLPITEEEQKLAAEVAKGNVVNLWGAQEAKQEMATLTGASFQKVQEIVGSADIENIDDILRVASKVVEFLSRESEAPLAEESIREIMNNALWHAFIDGDLRQVIYKTKKDENEFKLMVLSPSLKKGKKREWKWALTDIEDLNLIISDIDERIKENDEAILGSKKASEKKQIKHFRELLKSDKHEDVFAAVEALLKTDSIDAEKIKFIKRRLLDKIPSDAWVDEQGQWSIYKYGLFAKALKFMDEGKIFYVDCDIRRDLSLNGLVSIQDFVSNKEGAVEKKVVVKDISVSRGAEFDFAQNFILRTSLIQNTIESLELEIAKKYAKELDGDYSNESLEKLGDKEIVKQLIDKRAHLENLRALQKHYFPDSDQAMTAAEKVLKRLRRERSTSDILQNPNIMKYLEEYVTEHNGSVGSNLEIIQAVRKKMDQAMMSEISDSSILKTIKEIEKVGNTNWALIEGYLKDLTEKVYDLQVNAPVSFKKQVFRALGYLIMKKQAQGGYALAELEHLIKFLIEQNQTLLAADAVYVYVRSAIIWNRQDLRERLSFVYDLLSSYPVMLNERLRASLRISLDAYEESLSPEHENEEQRVFYEILDLIGGRMGRPDNAMTALAYESEEARQAALSLHVIEAEINRKIKEIKERLGLPGPGTEAFGGSSVIYLKEEINFKKIRNILLKVVQRPLDFKVGLSLLLEDLRVELLSEKSIDHKKYYNFHFKKNALVNQDLDVIKDAVEKAVDAYRKDSLLEGLQMDEKMISREGMTGIYLKVKSLTDGAMMTFNGEEGRKIAREKIEEYIREQRGKSLTIWGFLHKQISDELNVSAEDPDVSSEEEVLSAFLERPEEMLNNIEKTVKQKKNPGTSADVFAGFKDFVLKELKRQNDISVPEKEVFKKQVDRLVRDISEKRGLPEKGNHGKYEVVYDNSSLYEIRDVLLRFAETALEFEQGVSRFLEDIVFEKKGIPTTFVVPRKEYKAEFSKDALIYQDTAAIRAALKKAAQAAVRQALTKAMNKSEEEIRKSGLAALGIETQGFFFDNALLADMFAKKMEEKMNSVAGVEPHANPQLAKQTFAEAFYEASRVYQIFFNESLLSELIQSFVYVGGPYTSDKTHDIHYWKGDYEQIVFMEKERKDGRWKWVLKDISVLDDFMTYLDRRLKEEQDQAMATVVYQGPEFTLGKLFKEQTLYNVLKKIYLFARHEENGYAVELSLANVKGGKYHYEVSVKKYMEKIYVNEHDVKLVTRGRAKLALTFNKQGILRDFDEVYVFDNKQVSYAWVKAFLTDWLNSQKGKSFIEGENKTFYFKSNEEKAKAATLAWDHVPNSVKNGKKEIIIKLNGIKHKTPLAVDSNLTGKDLIEAVYLSPQYLELLQEYNQGQIILREDYLRIKVLHEFVSGPDESFKILSKRIQDADNPVSDPVIKEYFKNIGGWPGNKTQMQLFIKTFREVMKNQVNQSRLRSKKKGDNALVVFRKQLEKKEKLLRVQYSAEKVKLYNYRENYRRAEGMVFPEDEGIKIAPIPDDRMPFVEQMRAYEEKIKKQRPAIVRILLDLADNLKKQKKYKAAQKELDEIVRDYPETLEDKDLHARFHKIEGSIEKKNKTIDNSLLSGRAKARIWNMRANEIKAQEEEQANKGAVPGAEQGVTEKKDKSPEEYFQWYLENTEAGKKLFASAQTYKIDLAGYKRKGEEGLRRLALDIYDHSRSKQNAQDSDGAMTATVLIVDDNERNRRLMELYLKEIDCRILSASNGEEALEIIKNNKIQIVISDIDMPKMNGNELVRKAKVVSPETSIIFVSASNQPDSDVKDEIDAYYKKSVSREEIASHVQGILKQKADLAMTATILFVDDILYNVTSLADYFESLGCQVFTANSGEKALEIIKAENIQVLFSDIRMPVMDGNELIRRAKKVNPEVKAFVYSSEFSDIQEDVEKQIEEYYSRAAPYSQIVMGVRKMLEQKDEAVITDQVGGIDLNPAMLNLQIKRDANGVPLPLEMQPLLEMNIEGFVPVLINVTPVPDVLMHLGLADTQDSESVAYGGLSPLDRLKQS